jgi:hypothetical protein
LNKNVLFLTKLEPVKNVDEHLLEVLVWVDKINIFSTYLKHL